MDLKYEYVLPERRTYDCAILKSSFVLQILSAEADRLEVGSFNLLITNKLEKTSAYCIINAPFFDDETPH